MQAPEIDSYYIRVGRALIWRKIQRAATTA